MQISTQREAELLEKYNPYILKTVKTYSHANGWNQQYEDMVQEARMAFLLHLRSDKVPNEAHIFPCRLNLIDAVHKYVVKMHGVHVPVQQYKAYRDTYAMVSLDGATAPEIAAGAEDIEGDMDVMELLKHFSPEERQMAQLLAAGYRKSEVQRRLGLKNGALFRRMGSMRKKAETVYGWM